MKQSTMQRKFRKLRIQAGLTQTEAADRMGYGGYAVIGMKENGHRDVTKRDILAMERLVQLESES
jgi:DNA-binding XRE family transcriptional regulator